MSKKMMVAQTSKLCDSLQKEVLHPYNSESCSSSMERNFNDVFQLLNNRLQTVKMYTASLYKKNLSFHCCLNYE
ncbi:hypothetical protein Y1Q_0021218 [Alligator mississippiensis]|uniref:Uncharacterized protein n=1 Tax=Alligator mississippiensis TaxID=8496 RepID=A0A151MRY3_ALLMI|nr:hypothetical protein Y1Q_0021218 [Alligator mississippiensis]